MTLNPVPSHPSSLCYILKLHRDSQPANRQISGLLEHLGSGQSIPFSDAATLIEALLTHAATNVAQSHAGAAARLLPLVRNDPAGPSQDR